MRPWSSTATPRSAAASMSRPRKPNIHHRKQFLEEVDLLPYYRLTCIFVDRDHRRQGVTEVAIRGALDLIAAAGGGVVEGYPHEKPTKKVSSSFLYNAHPTVYERRLSTFRRPKGSEERRR